MDEVATKGMETQQSHYDNIGFSDRTGFGSRPAILVIDMCRGITEPGKMYIDMDTHIPCIAAILDAARRAGAPVIFTTVAYHADLSDAGMFGKKARLVQDFLYGSPLVDIDPRLPVLESDHLMVKKFPSAFYGTNLQSMLTGVGVDTTVVVGNSTSGCIRATVCDSVSGGFRTIVPEDCVADRAQLSHTVNLFDMDAKYADVVSSTAVVSYLDSLAGPSRLRAAG
ncbi:MAG: isochorismatase family protein [Alphaproteobacteria bacterium]|nr:isochorismatase family protein [Alphaproteobacteria bacterium]